MSWPPFWLSLITARRLTDLDHYHFAVCNAGHTRWSAQLMPGYPGAICGSANRAGSHSPRRVAVDIFFLLLFDLLCMASTSACRGCRLLRLFGLDIDLKLGHVELGVKVDERLRDVDIGR